MDEQANKRRRTNLAVIKDEGSTCSNNSRLAAAMPQEASADDTPIPVAVTSNPRVRQRSNSSSQTNTTNRDMGGATTNNNNMNNQNAISTSSNQNMSNTRKRVNSNADSSSNNSQQRNQQPPQQGQQQQESDQQEQPQQQQREQQHQLSEMDHTVRPLLRELRTGRTVDAALVAVERLYRALLGPETTATGNNSNNKNNNPKDAISLGMARSITQWNGCGAILMALKDWYMESTEFSCKAIRVLVLITGSVPIAKQFIVELGGLRTLVLVSEAGLHVYASSNSNVQQKKVRKQLTVQQRKQIEFKLQSNVVGLLHNLMGGVDYSIGKEVAAEECLDVVVAALKAYPNDKYTQKRGIRYLLKAGRMQDAQVITMLQKKQVGILFVQALDRFRNSNSSQDIKDIAQAALVWYATS